MHKVMMTNVILLATVAAVLVPAHAGDLVPPPGTPAPTMRTLDEISYRPSAAAIQSGQDLCWDLQGERISCAGTGQDGELRMGVGLNPRFTEGDDGTVRDNLTGLIWLRNANCFGGVDWGTALSMANGLASGACGLADGSVAGDWRLPNARELQTLVDYGRSLPAIPAAAGFIDVQSSEYWSSNTVKFSGVEAWYVEFEHGRAMGSFKTSSHGVWPIRGGQ